MSRKILALGLASAMALGWAGMAGAQPVRPQPLAAQMPELPPTPYKSAPDSPFTIYPLRHGLFMITGSGANVVVSTGPDGVLVVDPGAKASEPGLIAEIRRLSTLPVRTIIDTNGDPDHLGANASVARTGQTLEGGNTRPTAAVNSTGGAPIWAAEGVQNRLVAAGGDGMGWPSDTYFVAEKDMFFNGDPVQLLHAPAAHTDGDTMVMFRRSDVVAAGDVYTPDRYPVIDLEHGGSIDGLIDGLNYLLRLTIPEFNEEGGTWVVPGHGRLSDEADVADYRDMVTIVRDRIQDMVRRRMSLEQVQAARPTFEYDVLYGEASGRAFVEQVYRSLTAPRKADAAKTQPKGKKSS